MVHHLVISSPRMQRNLRLILRRPRRYLSIGFSLSSIQIETHEQKQSVFIESYGCQMNFSDTEIVYSIMNAAGKKYLIFLIHFHSLGYPTSESFEEADIIFLNTCAIRENAESKVWRR